MNLHNLEWSPTPHGGFALHCPRCEALWRCDDDEGRDIKPCPCVRFIWKDGALGAPSLEYNGRWRRPAFIKAYRAAHWDLYHDDEILDAELSSPDPEVLKQLKCSAIGEIYQLEENGLGCAPIWTCTFVALRPAAGSIRRSADRDIPEVEAAPLYPEWAAQFLGCRFDTRAARRAGWIDQGSKNAHFGVAHGNNVWLYKIEEGNACRPCGRIWWRFLLVKLARGGRIVQIRTQVDEVFPDGHGETITDEFIPPDVPLAIEALESATGTVAAGH